MLGPLADLKTKSDKEVEAIKSKTVRFASLIGAVSTLTASALTGYFTYQIKKPEASPVTAPVVASPVAPTCTPTDAQQASYDVAGTLIALALDETAGKGDQGAKLVEHPTRARLRRAVFEVMFELDGRADVLHGALAYAAKLAPEIQPETSTIEDEFRSLMVERLHWLQNKVTPAYFAAVNKNGQEQTDTKADVEAPEDLTVIKDKPKVYGFNDAQFLRSQLEAEMLKKRLTEKNEGEVSRRTKSPITFVMLNSSPGACKTRSLHGSDNIGGALRVSSSWGNPHPNQHLKDGFSRCPSDTGDPSSDPIRAGVGSSGPAPARPRLPTESDWLFRQRS